MSSLRATNGTRIECEDGSWLIHFFIRVNPFNPFNPCRSAFYSFVPAQLLLCRSGGSLTRGYGGAHYLAFGE